MPFLHLDWHSVDVLASPPPSLTISLLSVLGLFLATLSSLCEVSSCAVWNFHPPDFLPLLYSLCCFSASSLCSLFSLLLWMSAYAFPNSKSVGVSLGTFIFLTFLLPFSGPSYQSNQSSVLKKTKT